MKILFISGLYSSELLPEFILNSKPGTLQSACDTFQWAVVEGLYENNSDFFVFSCPWLPCYPISYKSHIISNGEIFYKGDIIGKSLGYNPLLAYKNYSIKKILKKNVLNWINSNISPDERFVALTYTPEPFFIEPLSEIKKQCPKMLIASIVTDLVDDMFNFESNRSSWLKKLQCYINIKETKRCYDHIDKFILLTKQMVEKIPQAFDRNIVIEGIYKNSSSITSSFKKTHTLLYTGVLEEYAGVKLLLDAFSRIPSNGYKLIICGSGPLSSYISKVSSFDDRIEFRGAVPREEAVMLQKSVSLLINPRQPNGSITKYSFPSKTMEYMSSGTPMIGYKLEGIPEEYYKYMYIPKDLSIASLSEVIDKCLSFSDNELHSFGSLARNFIIENKTAKKQVEKIINFFN